MKNDETRRLLDVENASIVKEVARRRENTKKRKKEDDETLMKEVAEQCGDLYESKSLEEVLWIIATNIDQVRRPMCEFCS